MTKQELLKVYRKWLVRKEKEKQDLISVKEIAFSLSLSHQELWLDMYKKNENLIEIYTETIKYLEGGINEYI